MILLTQDSIDRLNTLLKLPASGFEQDWDIELSDAYRIKEFLDIYLNHNTLSISDKKALMALIISSCEDAINTDSFSVELWEKLKAILSNDRQLHSDLIEYWTNSSESDGSFQIARYLAKLWVT